MSELSLKKPLGLGLAVICAAIALSALVGAPASLLAAKPLYFVFGFEVVILLASVFGVLVALGRFAEGPGLALVCVAAIVAAGSLLGDQTAKLANPISGPVVYHFKNVDRDVTLYLALRVLSAVLIAGGATALVLGRRPKESTGSLVRGLGAMALLVAIVGGGWGLRSAIGAMGPFPATMVALAIGVIALGLVAASVHFVVRAFEFGRIHDGVPPAGAKPTKVG